MGIDDFLKDSKSEELREYYDEFEGGKILFKKLDRDTQTRIIAEFVLLLHYVNHEQDSRLQVVISQFMKDSDAGWSLSDFNFIMKLINYNGCFIITYFPKRYNDGSIIEPILNYFNMANITSKVGGKYIVEPFKNGFMDKIDDKSTYKKKLLSLIQLLKETKKQ